MNCIDVCTILPLWETGVDAETRDAARLLPFLPLMQESSSVAGSNVALMLLIPYKPPAIELWPIFLFQSQPICLILIHQLLQLIMAPWQDAGVRDRWHHSGHIRNVGLKCQLSIQTWLIRGSLVKALISAWASFVTMAPVYLRDGSCRDLLCLTYVKPGSLHL